MARTYIIVVAVMWIGWLLSWQVAAFWRSRPTVQAPRRDYRWMMGLIALGLLLDYGIYPKNQPQLWPVGPVLGWAMVGLTAAGIAFAWWARIALGKLWSGGVERKAEHRVVETGPYAYVRHPIYTGMIAGATALAALQAKPFAVLGAALFALGFMFKARLEERFLETELGGYEDYRRRVPMLIPFARFK
ncbi:isoprenylcysteine carboxylmethyltransferase family protein [Altererythrobacter salegens]|uniref:Isoprenylcysteine carboxylmethyltransferase family protein n=1 Tax=Croceibacterium salegens TaxID=1737568 RepID=A0A6I4SXI6_9SPHN|nr:isoprenylcysteine carboxylmethyltransferase family protein [Croceibacterium salegens]MXO60049.1 isoprenylcysteine carboxylmethyltransferase family protein [Croceibacterium salegens]